MSTKEALSQLFTEDLNTDEEVRFPCQTSKKVSSISRHMFSLSISEDNLIQDTLRKGFVLSAKMLLRL
jgi:hypothetical protein